MNKNYIFFYNSLMRKKENHSLTNDLRYEHSAYIYDWVLYDLEGLSDGACIYQKDSKAKLFGEIYSFDDLNILKTFDEFFGYDLKSMKNSFYIRKKEMFFPVEKNKHEKKEAYFYFLSEKEIKHFIYKVLPSGKWS